MNRPFRDPRAVRRPAGPAGVPPIRRHLFKLRNALLRPRNLQRTVQAASDPRVILLYWQSEGGAARNWGDKLNPVLVERLSGCTVIDERLVVNIARKPVYLVIGSSLGKASLPEAIVWGHGFIAHHDRPLCRFRSVRSVRGPLTRQILRSHGIDCPDIYGDPALLCPRFYPAGTQKKYVLGLIPHWSDKHLPIVSQLAQQPDICVIDIEGGIEEVIAEATSCRYIASSSLHGIILADAYRVPNLWLRLSDNPKGDYFKYLDYFQSVGRSTEVPFIPTPGTRASELIDRMSNHEPQIDLDRMLDACPFRKVGDAPPRLARA